MSNQKVNIWLSSTQIYIFPINRPGGASLCLLFPYYSQFLNCRNSYIPQRHGVRLPRMRNFKFGILKFGTGMAAEETSPSLLHAREPQKRMFLPSQSACGNLEDLTKLITCQKTRDMYVYAEKKTPAAAGKTSPSL